VHYPRPAAHGAILGIDLRIAAAQIDMEFLGFAAERARNGS
jgi:hypothetical protein